MSTMNKFCFFQSALPLTQFISQFMIYFFIVPHFPQHSFELVIGFFTLSFLNLPLSGYPFELRILDNRMSASGLHQQLANPAFLHQIKNYWINACNQQQKMMKQKAPQQKQPAQKINIIDGPPLDFSFKSIRSIDQIVKLNPVGHNEHIQEATKSEFYAPKNSQKQIGESNLDTRLNIVRTIEVEETKKDIVKQLVHKKAQKTTSKIVHKTQTKTTSLFLRYNKLRELNGFMQIVQQLLPGNKWEQLIWIDLSHNRLSNVSKEFQCLPQLKNLYLHVNFIHNFKEFQNIKEAKLLRTFTIHGNPIENYPQFRSLLTSILPQLQKIDSALLTKRQKQRGEVIKKQGAKYPVIQNPQKPPQESQQEDES